MQHKTLQLQQPPPYKKPHQMPSRKTAHTRHQTENPRGSQKEIHNTGHKPVPKALSCRPSRGKSLRLYTAHTLPTTCKLKKKITHKKKKKQKKKSKRTSHRPSMPVPIHYTQAIAQACQRQTQVTRRSTPWGQS
jgi:hypothetical protein